MKQGENADSSPLKSDEAQEALKFIKQHVTEIGNEILQFSIPNGYKNGEAKEYIANQLVIRSKELHKKLGIQYPKYDANQVGKSAKN